MAKKKTGSGEGYTPEKRFWAGVKRFGKMFIVVLPVFVEFIPKFPDIPEQAKLYAITILLMVMAMEKALQRDKS